MADPGEHLNEPLLRRLAKTLLYPVRVARWALRGKKYNTADGYREDKYWEDRHKQFEGDFRAVASYSEEVDDRYPRQREQLWEIFKRHGVEIEGRRAIEFGCGNGFWCESMLESGAASYMGVDISETAVDYCRRTYPKGEFLKHHLGDSPAPLDKKYDLVCSIDVTQHVVEKPKLMQFLNDMRDCADPSSLIFCTSYLVDQEKSGVRQQTMNVNFVVGWSVDDVSEGFQDCELVDTHKFWDKAVLVFRKPAE